MARPYLRTLFCSCSRVLALLLESSTSPIQPPPQSSHPSTSVKDSLSNANLRRITHTHCSGTEYNLQANTHTLQPPHSVTVTYRVKHSSQELEQHKTGTVQYIFKPHLKHLQIISVSFSPTLSPLVSILDGMECTRHRIITPFCTVCMWVEVC